jgi:uncharacterized OB-fold protein
MTSATGTDRASEFFEAAAAGQLLVGRCETCGELYPPAVETCALGHPLGWQRCTGRASLVTWAVDHAPASAPDRGDSAGGGSAAAGAWDTFGIVELDEGVWIQAPLASADATALHAGLVVTVTFQRVDSGRAIPVFSPSST